MSIKIPNGLAATDPETGLIINSGSVFWIAQQIRQVTETVFFDRLWQLFCDNTPEQLGLDPAEHDSPGRIIRGVAERVVTLHARQMHTFDDLDLGYSISLLDGTGPGEEPGQGHLLMLIHGEHADELYIPALKKADLVRSHGYWDDTEGPAELSDLQWQERKRIWGTALSSADRPEPFGLTPNQAGLTISHPSRFPIVLELQQRYRASQGGS